MDYLNPDFIKYQQAEKLQLAAQYRLGQQVLKAQPNKTAGSLKKILLSIRLPVSGLGFASNRSFQLKQAECSEA